MTTKITDLTAQSENIADADVFPMVDTSDTTQAASGTTKKVSMGDLRSGVRASATIVFGDNSNPFVSISSTSYSTIGAVVFAGTEKVGTPSTFKVIAANNNVGKTTEVRIFDVTNSLEIAIVTVTGTTQAILADSSLINLPIDEAILEVQARRISSGVTVDVWMAQVTWGV